MATLNASCVCDNSSLANFKNWAQEISTAFSTLGWVQTSDTGQVNWSTIAAVPSSTYVYEIWKANGSNASSMPIYVKVGYGFSSTVPAVEITVGTGSNGSGTITGVVTTGAPLEPTLLTLTNKGATTFQCYFSGSADDFRMYMWGASASNQLGELWVIDRSKNSSGADTASYFTVCVACSIETTGIASNKGMQQSLSAAQLSSQHTCLCTTTVDGVVTTGANWGTVAAYPVFPDVGQVGNPLLGLMKIYAGDGADTNTVTVNSMYGSSHTYVVVKDTGSSGGFSSFCNRLGAGFAALLMQYE